MKFEVGGIVTYWFANRRDKYLIQELKTNTLVYSGGPTGGVVLDSYFNLSAHILDGRAKYVPPSRLGRVLYGI